MTETRVLARDFDRGMVLVAEDGAGSSWVHAADLPAELELLPAVEVAPDEPNRLDSRGRTSVMAHDGLDAWGNPR